MGSGTFGQKVLNFYNTLELPETRRFGVEIINPLTDPTVQQHVVSFYTKFYSDTQQRTFIFGINPGRFGFGVTGIPFTDSVALETHSGIKNDLPRRRELSAEFVYECIEAFGGPTAFFGNFYLTAISPIGFTKNGLNYNYYDDTSFYTYLRPFLMQTIKDQVDFGAARENVIVFGSGKNLRIFQELNDELQLFQTILPLEHPRYIMQYKRKERDVYVKKYTQTFSSALPQG